MPFKRCWVAQRGHNDDRRGSHQPRWTVHPSFRPISAGTVGFSALYRRLCIGVLCCYLPIELGLFAGGIAPLGGFGTSLQTAPKLLQLIPGLVLGLLVMAPRGAVGRGRVSLLAILYLSWLSASILWSVDSVYSFYIFRTSVLPGLCIVMLMAVVPVEFVVTAVRLVSRFAILLVAVVVAIDPLSRVTEDGAAGLLEGWRGSFVHKNQMGMMMVLIALFAYFFEPTRLRKWLVVAGAAALAIGSSSTGATAGLVLALGASVSKPIRARGVRPRCWGVGGGRPPWDRGGGSSARGLP